MTTTTKTPIVLIHGLWMTPAAGTPGLTASAPPATR